MNDAREGGPDSAPEVAVVVVHFGSSQPTVKICNRVRRLKFDGKPPRIIVVANDQSIKPGALDPSIEWIVAERNLGYGGAANLAFDQCAAEFYVLLNNDVEISEQTYASCLSVLRDDSRVGVVAPTLKFPDGKLQSGPGSLSKVLKQLRVLGRKPQRGPIVCEWVTGAVMFLHGATVRAVRFDASFFLGSEDVDYCLRLGSLGYRTVCLGDEYAFHDRSQTIGAMWSYYGMRNRLWLIRKHFGRMTLILACAHVGVLCLKHTVADVAKGRGTSSIRLAWAGYRDSFREKPSESQGPWEAEPVPMTKQSR